RRVEAFHWGLIPSWAKDRKIASKMINARSETLAEKPAFKALFKKKRILIPMDGFYEWKPGEPDGPLTAKGTPMKQPMFIRREDREPLAVAGLWAAWKDPAASPERVEAGEHWLHSATIVTTAANETMQPVHDRMPVTVPPERWAEWLDPANDDLEALSTLFTGAATPWVMHPVSTDVNKVSNNSPSLIEPIPELG
ncbi:MAG: SOS response-associated peptidase, partial [Actinomycetota bacterium]